MTLEGKTVLLGVTGSIAAYKIAYLASALKKRHADVHVLMTENATNFINPITFETLTGNKCLVDTFDRNFQFQVEHVSIAKKADVVMIAPASANVIGKLAHGIADDMLTTTIMACKCKKFISPAMNINMFENPVVQDNLKILEHYGYEVIAPVCGYLACGDTGTGKMPEPETLLAYIERETACEKDLKEKKILVTIKNNKSGKKNRMKIGQKLNVWGTKQSFHPPRNPGNFNQKSYYQKQGIHVGVLTKAEQVEIVLSEKDKNWIVSRWNSIRNQLDRLKNYWNWKIVSQMGKTHGAMLSAILLGEKSGLDPEMKKLYQKNGLGHLLAKKCTNGYICVQC